LSGLSAHSALVALEFALALVTVVALAFVRAPYGRYAGAGWGPTLSERSGWLLMESPAVLFFAAVYLRGAQRAETVPLVLLGLWQLHYLQRALLFPFRLRGTAKRMPVLVVLLGAGFNFLNAWINARWISEFGHYPTTWLADPRFVAGAAIFVGGLSINIASDRALLRLRAPGETGYRVPHGGLFEWVSCPNYLGEIIEWFGWALATWSWAGLAFAVFTVANLLPRALAHHRWYRAQFPGYPTRRRALVPGVL
jgi:protein-S-isoprenylcysteine O-methyltransferase Ste14